MAYWQHRAARRSAQRAISPAKLLVIGALAAGGIVLSLAVAFGTLTTVMARTIVTPPRKRKQDVGIQAVDVALGTITLQATEDSVLPGRYGLWFGNDTGHLRLGEIIRSTPATVTRRIDGVDFGDPQHSGIGRLSGWYYLGPWDLGLDYEDVLIPTLIGPSPAWFIPAGRPGDPQDTGETDRWVIQVHGRAVTRQETLRSVTPFREAGYNSLLISYRNDGIAPASPDGRYGLGDTEWRDVDSAIAWAIERGATNVVLMGWSMGGAIALQTATRSAHRDVIDGIVLDSPVIEWADVVDYQGTLLGLPNGVATGAMHLLGQPWASAVTGQEVPIDFDRLDFVARAEELTLPMLIMHSDDDGYVPATGSRALAAKRPDIVTFVPFARARHTKLWNYDPDAWGGAIRTWLADVIPNTRLNDGS